jgi:acetylornithine deacetylase
MAGIGRLAIVLSSLHCLVSALPQVQPPPSACEVSATASSFVPAPSASLTSEEKDELFDLHEKLVDIPSISGNEGDVAEFTLNYLTDVSSH